MSKPAPSKRRDSPHSRDRRLRSIYSQKSGAVETGKVPPVAEGSAAKFIQAKELPQPRVWNLNKPKILKNYDVYAKQPPPSANDQKVAKPLPEWVAPPYPVKRPKEKKKNQGDSPCNYETFYVPFDDDDDDDGGSSASSHARDQGLFAALDNWEIPKVRRQMDKRKTDVPKEVKAERPESDNEQEESEKLLKDEGEKLLQEEGENLLEERGENQFKKGGENLPEEGGENQFEEGGENQLEEEPAKPCFTEFPPLPSAGERYALKLQEESHQMACLIAEVQEIRRQHQLATQEEKEEEEKEEKNEDEEGEPKPAPLMRSRTRDIFPIPGCHPTLLEYARRLPFIPAPKQPPAAAAGRPGYIAGEESFTDSDSDSQASEDLV